MSIPRRLLLAASTNIWLRERATRTAFVRRAVSAFMPGERLEDAVEAAITLRELGMGAMLTKLGENVTTADEAADVTGHYLESLDRIRDARLDAQISVKPTQLGLDLDAELCFRNLMRLVERAADRGTLVWVDMESSPYVDRTLELFRRARARSAAVGVAIQAYLHRSAQDVEGLIPLGATIRLVKGAYLEPPHVAFPRKTDVDANYHRLACRLLSEEARRAGAFLQIATHDSVLVERLAAFIADLHVPQRSYEYAMLYGIERAQQVRLAQGGRRLRVLISYGEYWFPWYMRRLAERPANVWFVVRKLWS
jgi:proline dehydrogenase